MESKKRTYSTLYEGEGDTNGDINDELSPHSCQPIPDFDCPISDEKINVIENFVLQWLRQLADGQLPVIQTQKRTGANMELVICKDTSLPYLEIQNGTTSKKMREHPRSYVAICCVLQFSFKLLQAKKTATQRELYYSFVNFFKDQKECNEAILDCAAALGVTRTELGIYASSKGYFVGNIVVKFGNNWIDCSSLENTSGMIISYDWVTSEQHFTSSARYIIVVEKDGIFNRLSEDRIFDQFPCILVTGKGFPDLATRALVSQLAFKLKIPVLGLCDFNPYGLALLLTYKIGSIRMGAEAASFIVDVKWLGLRSSHLKRLSIPSNALQKMSAIDFRRAKSLKSSPFVMSDPRYAEEVANMLEMKCKCELEALHSFGMSCIGEFLEKSIICQDYI